MLKVGLKKFLRSRKTDRFLSVLENEGAATSFSMKGKKFNGFLRKFFINDFEKHHHQN